MKDILGSKSARAIVHGLTVAAAVATYLAVVPGKVGEKATAALAVISGILHLVGAQSGDATPAK